ncbi:hypothetical protein [Burkholderia plantarii]|uniref:hypothetical protein n=1 Tax=Burkholderia plantarii TaxID=41899 RepID=UPI0013144F10|nr:hypothetical protein [Burkholderia plantarii]
MAAIQSVRHYGDAERQMQRSDSIERFIGACRTLRWLPSIRRPCRKSADSTLFRLLHLSNQPASMSPKSRNVGTEDTSYNLFENDGVPRSEITYRRNQPRPEAMRMY